MYRSCVHPDRNQQFRAAAAPKRVIKQGRRGTHLACTNCGRADEVDGVKLKQCSECQAAQYCSRDCQKENWPVHKEHCEPSLEGGIQPLIRSVTGNPMLSHFIQICISFEYHLHELEKTMDPEQRKKFVRSPLGIHIDVGIEPTKITEFMNLYTHKGEWDKEDMEGMLQFHHLSSYRSGLKPEMVFTPSKMAMWKHSREKADEDGLEDKAVIMVLFVNNFKQAIACTMIIGDATLESAREAEPFTMSSALTGKTTVHPMGVESCIEYMNTHIRSDKNDHLLLRRRMRDSDKELIRDAGRRDVDYHSVAALRLKVNREHVYTSHALIVVPPGGGTEEARVQFVGVSREVADRINDEYIERSADTAHAGENVEQEQPNPPRNRAERRRMEREMKKAQKKKGH